MGLFYGVMAVRKRSLGLAALAVLTGNMGLWVLWHHCGWDFLEHPQLWLIPLALAVLVAEHLDRRRLSEPQRTAIRYLALSVIYVSSTTEFWRNIGQSAILPLVTILLAVLGRAGRHLAAGPFVPLPGIHVSVGGHRPDDRLSRRSSRGTSGSSGRAAFRWARRSSRCSPFSRSGGTTCWPPSSGSSSGTGKICRLHL